MKRINLIKLGLIFLLNLVLFSLGSKKAWAVVKTSGDLQVTYDDPLFSASTVWYPGLTETRSFKVKNIGSKKHQNYTKAEDYSDTGNLAQVLFLSLKKGSNYYFGSGMTKTMRDFWNQGDLRLTDINSGEELTYDITIYFSSSAGNEYQGKQAKFDLVIRFADTDDEVVIGVGGDGDGGDGAVVSALSDLSFQIGGYLPVFYEEEEEVEEKGEVEGVIEEEGEVKGEATCPWWESLWWLPLLIQAVLSFLYYFLIRKREIKNWFSVPLMLGILSQIVHWILGCQCALSFLCPWYWLFNLLIFSFSSFYYQNLKSKI
ncbi:hypothetical protein COT75_04530 [Candidatus Beckwithbacteria bacterium CG10_big_fil_rev_8_21_14_0_10_34_10]|uniref:Uncharacterized protein n=1 Tax=Candidatus Beckwithbacteria bacterium CG10_big_fil_rev_8_21_14_0_10_34_10 TaxID=1974495 RepID=A0A2H0W844_9BACT|nr:MAG: hypothetical protein COT75_04530 [Candidatus Beckwithbacteria bacterium CG10_big_fil_rev_8_21_14_0_10_34_10]